MTTEKFTVGHLATNGPLNLPKSLARNAQLSKAARRHQAAKRLPAPSLNWVSKQLTGDKHD